MNFITDNTKISTDVLYSTNYLEHGFAWGKHKYIRKEGNRYIYPEDLKGRRASRNNWNATLFGDRSARRQAKRSVTEADRAARNVRRAERKAARYQAKADRQIMRSQDVTLSAKTRERALKKAQKYAEKYDYYNSSLKSLSAVAENSGRKAAEDMRKYNRTRKIDDLSASVVDLGRAFAGALHRSRSSTKRSKAAVDAAQERGKNLTEYSRPIVSRRLIARDQEAGRKRTEQLKARQRREAARKRWSDATD